MGRFKPAYIAELNAFVDSIKKRKLHPNFATADDGLAGIQQLAGDATMLFYLTEEGQEGRNAFKEKREPNFNKFPKRP